MRWRVTQRDLQEYKEDGSILTGTVISSQELGLECDFTDERNEDTAQADQHELAASESFNVEGAKQIAWYSRGDPERSEEKRHKSCHSEGDVEQDTIVGNDEDASELVVPHEHEADKRPSSIGRRFDDLIPRSASINLTIELDLLLHLVEFFAGKRVVRISFGPMQADDHLTSFIKSIVHHEPTGTVREPWRAREE